MGARYPYYLLADSHDGQLKEAEVAGIAPSSQATHGDIRYGFVYQRVPHIALKSIANNAEIDVIWDRWPTVLEPLRKKLNSALKTKWQEWEIPRNLEEAHAEARTRKTAKGSGLGGLASLRELPSAARQSHSDWWEARIAAKFGGIRRAARCGWRLEPAAASDYTRQTAPLRRADRRDQVDYGGPAGGL